MKNKLTGLGNIYGFTVVQSLKTKSMKIVTCILCVIALLSMPIITLINGSGEKNSTSIKKVKVVDMTGFQLTDDLEVLKDDDIYKDIVYEEADIDYGKMTPDTKMKDIYEFEEDADYVYMQITYFDNIFDTEVIYSNDTKVKKSDVTDYCDFVSENFRSIIVKHSNLTEEQLKTVNSTEVITYQEDKELDEKAETLKEDESTSRAKYWIIYFMTMLVLFALAFGGERVAMNIVTDKASKVMEYLLTSVKPMAVVVGKILASVTVLFIQLGLVVVSLVVSVIVNGLIFSDGKGLAVPPALKRIFNINNFAGLNVYNVLFAILILVGGFIFFGLIAGLAGASVSKLDEIAEGVKMYSFTLVISAYVVLFCVIQGTYEGTSAMRYVIMFLPFTSVFIVPAMLITGYMTLIETIISLAVMCAGLLLMIKFVSNVYESMVYYSGAPLKLKDIINISKKKRQTGGEQ